MPVLNNIYSFETASDIGTTPPIVLIHGAGGTHLSWPPELRRFSGKNVYAMDLPGHGKSEGHGEQTLSAYADRVAAWMTEAGLFRAFVVGHSMGGGIALELALRYPHLTAAIGLVASGARLPIAPDLLAYTQNSATFPSALEILRKRSFGPGAPERLVDLAMQRLATVRPSVMHNDFHACAEFDFTEKLPGIRRPLLAVCGSEDQLTPLRLSQFVASKVEKSDLHVVQGAGHMVMLEEGQEVARIIGDFLKKLKSGY